MKTSKNRWKVLRAAAFVIIISAVPPVAHAVGFVLNPGGVDNAANFTRSHQYFFGAGGVTPLVNGTNWRTTLTDAAGAAGARNLTVGIQHIAGTGVPPAGPVFNFSFPGIKQPVIGAVDVLGRAEQLNHGAAVDLGRATVSIRAGAEPPSAATVITSGQHVPAGTPFAWSLTNTGGVPLTAVAITPSYREAGTGNLFDGSVINRVNLAAGGTDRGALPVAAINPANGILGRLSDYKVQAFGSGQSETMLAFAGKVDGAINELDLGSATRLFKGSDEFLVPMFSRNDNTSDLFVAVDLTQWLSAGGSLPLSTGESFNISGGTNPSLPGFLFSTSPITFVPGTGFITANPLGGENVHVRAMIDGVSVVPEPSTVPMFGAGLLVIMAALRRLRANPGTQ